MQVLEQEPEKKITLEQLDKDVINSVLLVLKEAISNKTINDPLKRDIATSLGKHIDTSLAYTNISFSNKEALLVCLAENFEMVKPLINACRRAREYFGKESYLRLDVNMEKEDPSFFTLSLAVECNGFDEKKIDTIEEFSTTVSNPFLELGIVFYVEPIFL